MYFKFKKSPIEAGMDPVSPRSLRSNVVHPAGLSTHAFHSSVCSIVNDSALWAKIPTTKSSIAAAGNSLAHPFPNNQGGECAMLRCGTFLQPQPPVLDLLSKFKENGERDRDLNTILIFDSDDQIVCYITPSSRLTKSLQAAG